MIICFGNLGVVHSLANSLLSRIKELHGVEAYEELNVRRHKARPACLAAYSDTGPIVPVEVLMNEDVVIPVRVGLELIPILRTPAYALSHPGERY